MIIQMDPSLNTLLLFLLCSSFPPQTQNSKFKNHGQYPHNLLGLITLSFSVLFIHNNMDLRSPNWVRHAKCTWSSSTEQDLFKRPFTPESPNREASGEELRASRPPGSCHPSHPPWHSPRTPPWLPGSFLKAPKILPQTPNPTFLDSKNFCKLKIKYK